MKHKLLLLALFYFTIFTSFSQVANQPSNYFVCDDNQDGFNQFDFDSNISPQIYANQSVTDFSLTYHVSQSDADNGTNSIVNTSSFTNFNNPQTIYARLVDNSNGNFDTTSFLIGVFLAPIINTSYDNELSQCDDLDANFMLNNDGFSVFDLTLEDAEIINGNSSWTVDYYETLSDAQSNTNEITNPTSYSNITAGMQTLHIRVTDNNTGCFSFTTVAIIVIPNPEAGSPVDLELCDVNNSGDLIEFFDLTLNEFIIINGQIGNTISYYISQADALAETNPIVNPTMYNNIVSPQTIYVRLQNDMTSCYSLVSFNLIVNALPVVTLESQYELCIGESIVLDSGVDLTLGNYNFEWEQNGILIPGEIGATLTVTMGGAYGVNVIDVNSSCSTGFISTTVNEITCVDSDSDGVNDADEDLNSNGNLDDDDTDMDMIPNYLDDDDDGDNVPTNIEINIPTGRMMQHPFVDTDLDGIENYLDDDDDGDLILTINEDYNNNGDPTDDDTNMNGTPDYLETSVALSVYEYNAISFEFYPNPANTLLNIKLNNVLSGNASIEIIDIKGKQIFSKLIDNEVAQIQLDISNFHSGLYIVKLKQDTSVTIKKLIIE